MELIFSWIITVTATVVSGWVLFLLKRFFNNQQKKEEIRDKIKAEESALVLRTLNALGKLTVANSIALKDGKTNGELTEALKEYEMVEKELYRYLVSDHVKGW